MPSKDMSVQPRICLHPVTKSGIKSTKVIGVHFFDFVWLNEAANIVNQNQGKDYE